MTAVFLAILTFGLALFALTRQRLLWGVLGVGAHSLSLAGLYLALSAPDVAITEAAVGFGLVTLIYLLAVRRTGKLVVAACPLYPLLYQEGERVAGLEWEILTRFAQWCHRDLELFWVSRRELSELLRAGEAHLAAGGFLPGPQDPGRPSRALVSARLLRVRTGEGPGPLGQVEGEPASGADTSYEDAADLLRALQRGELSEAFTDSLRFREWQLFGLLPEAEATVLPEEASFRFLVAPEEEELWEGLEEFLRELEARGVLAELVRKYLG